jgi:hypothetical protein
MIEGSPRWHAIRAGAAHLVNFVLWFSPPHRVTSVLFPKQKHHLKRIFGDDQGNLGG